MTVTHRAASSRMRSLTFFMAEVCWGVQPYCISLMLLESFRDHHTFHVGDESDANTSNTILHDASVLGCPSALTTQPSQLVSNVMRVSK